MVRYIIRRLIFSIPVLLAASILVFYVVKTTTDPLAAIRTCTRCGPKLIEQLRHQLGLDKSGISQYTAWLGHFVRGDWGVSLQSQLPVRHDIIQALGNSAVLGLAGVVFSLIIGAGIGILSAVKQYSWFDNLATGGAFLGLSMPNFWFALLLQVFFGLQLRNWLHMQTP